MDFNYSKIEILTLQSLDLPASASWPSFIFGFLTYFLIVFCNVSIILTIILNKTLHKPMFLLLLNMPICDLLGATAFFPPLILRIIHQSKPIPYSACVLQAFLVHFCGGGSLLILSAMAYDRYVAICYPLSYNTIMNPCKVIQLIVSIWVSDFGWMGTMIILFVQYRICRSHIVDTYCNNPSLLKLVCDDKLRADHFGLTGIVLYQGFSLATIVFTYLRILITCYSNKHARVKAIQTSAVHLVVFLLLEILAGMTLLSHRIPKSSPYLRRAFGVSVLIFPPLLNPLIYGFILKDIREKNILFLLAKNKVHSRI